MEQIEDVSPRTAVAAVTEKYRLCLVTYRFSGNGPWNYMFERPPAGVKLLHKVGVYVEETERHHIVADNWMTLEDGSVLPTHKVHFGKDCSISFL